MIVVFLAVLGLCLGSFVNAVVWRIREQDLRSQSLDLRKKKRKVQDLSILHGRSQCTDCGHQLAPKDLIPVLSWLFLRGRCRYCKKPISPQYPVVELVLAVVFVASYLFWPNDLGQLGQWLLLATWLGSSVGLLALLIYDLKWMLLPNRILYPTFFVALAGRLAYIAFFAPQKVMSYELLVISLLVASGIFYLLFYVSQGRWIGFGDVRLGLITGTVLGKPSLSLLMIFIASVLGTLFAMPSLLSGRKKLVSKLPYGPFLIVATAICLLWGESLIHWYKSLLT